MLLASKLFYLLCRRIPGRTSQTLGPPDGKSNRLNDRPPRGSYSDKNLMDFTHASRRQK